jgi:hypothetical protein
MSRRRRFRRACSRNCSSQARSAERFLRGKTHQLKMIGTYHQFGTFISGVASLPRVVILTMHDVSLTPKTSRQGPNPGPNQLLVLQGTVKTYRYLDDGDGRLRQQVQELRSQGGRNEIHDCHQTCVSAKLSLLIGTALCWVVAHAACRICATGLRKKRPSGRADSAAAGDQDVRDVHLQRSGQTRSVQSERRRAEMKTMDRGRMQDDQTAAGGFLAGQLEDGWHASVRVPTWKH